MAHLGELARSQSLLSDEERIQLIYRRLWFDYDIAVRILKKMSSSRDYPKGPRMPSILLFGEPGNGKTTLLDRFAAQNPARENPDGEGAIVPLIAVQAPPGGEERAFLLECLGKIGAGFNNNSPAHLLRSQLVGLMRVVGLKMLVVDELQHIGDGSAKKQQHFLNTLKYLTNELQIAVVCAGDDEAMSIIRSDKQIESRFEILELPLWEVGDELSALLDTLELCLPLRLPSDLGSPELSELILNSSVRTLDSILKVVRAAAERAITSKVECITPRVLRGENAAHRTKAHRRVG